MIATQIQDGTTSAEEVAEILQEIHATQKGKKLKPVELSPAQERIWTEARAGFLWAAPAFASLLYNMMSDKEGNVAFFTEDCPVAATDGSRMFINPKGFFSGEFSLDNRVAMLGHEVLHCVFDHPGQMHRWAKAGHVKYADGTEIPFDHGYMNIAADYLVNDMLAQSKIGVLHPDFYHDPDLVKGTDSLIDAYKKVYVQKENEKKSGGATGQGSGGGKGSFDEHLAPGASEGKDPDTSAAERNETEWQTQIAAAVAAAKAQGNLPGFLERVLSTVLEPVIDWAAHLRQTIIKRLGSDKRSWKRLDRRLIVRGIGAPGKVGYGCDLVVVAVDTSGSITPATVDMFMAETASILEDVRPKEVKIVWCDARVQRVDEACDTGDLEAIRVKGAPGGGGTDFRPVFDLIDDEGWSPDAVLYLTDGIGRFPDEEPDYPVVWGNTYPASTYPWGQVVNIPAQAT